MKYSSIDSQLKQEPVTSSTQWFIQTHDKTIQDNHFRALETDQKITTNQEMFIPENGSMVELCSIFPWAYLQ